MNILKRYLRRFLDRKGYVLQRRVLYEREQQLYRDALGGTEQSVAPILSMVFSKDRAMQLQAFLRSYLTQVKNAGAMYVLYRASNPQCRRDYESLQASLADDGRIFWIEETDFRQQCLTLLEQAAAKAQTVAMYVDDMLFLYPVDYEVFSHFSMFTYIPSLCRGGDMTYSAVLDRPIDLPDFTPTSQADLLAFPWNQYDYLSDWTYPMGVSGYMYDGRELLAVCRRISFKNPNSLESAMQAYKEIFAKRQGLCYAKAACCCIHANRVQTECDNSALGYFSIEELSQKWEQGYQIDLNAYYGKSRNEAYCQKYTFEKR